MFCPVATRFELAKASRVWRQGVPTALVMDQGLHMLQDAESVQVLTHWKDKCGDRQPTLHCSTA